MSSYQFNRPGVFTQTDTSKANYTPSPDNLSANAALGQAITDASGHKYNSLKERLDNVDSISSSHGTQLAQIASYKNSLVINVLYPPSGYTAAKGDGVTDDTSAIQSLMNYVNSLGGGILYFPPTTNGYILSPNTLVYKDKVKWIGTSTKIIFKSSATSGANGIYNFTDSLNLVYFEGFNFSTSKDYTTNDGNGTYSTSYVTLFHFKNVQKIVLKDIMTDSFVYTLKTDSDATIGELITDNVTGNNCVMFFLLNYVGKWTGRNLTSNLTNTTSLNHHYYIQRGVQNVDLNQVVCNNGNGYVLHFNDSSAPDDSTNRVDNFVVKHLTVNNCAMGVIVNAPLRGLYIRDSVFRNNTSGAILTIYNVNCQNVIFDGFRFLNCQSIVNSTASAGYVTNIQFKNGYIDKPVNSTSVGTIDNIIFETIFFADANCVNNSADLTFTLSGTYVQCILKNIILNYPTTITNNAGIRISGIGKFIMDNLIAHGASANASLGQFIYFPGTTARTVTINRCESDMFSSFIYPATPDASVTLNKYNNLQKGATV